jgi:hypothetical protein
MTVGFARLFPPCFRYPIALSLRPAVLLDRRVTLMSALGQKQTYAAQKVMSALHPKADTGGAARDVRFGPKADIRSSRRIGRLDVGKLGQL